MRISKLMIFLLLSLASAAAHAGRFELASTGAIGSRPDPDGHEFGGGLSARLLFDAAPWLSLGLAADHLWYAVNAPETQATEQDLFFLVSFGRDVGRARASFDAGLGAAYYHGDVEPGAHAASGKPTPALEIGGTVRWPIAKSVAFQLGARLLETLEMGGTDAHFFTPPGTSLRLDAGIALAF